MMMMMMTDVRSLRQYGRVALYRWHATINCRPLCVVADGSKSSGLSVTVARRYAMSFRNLCVYFIDKFICRLYTSTGGGADPR